MRLSRERNVGVRQPAPPAQPTIERRLPQPQAASINLSRTSVLPPASSNNMARKNSVKIHNAQLPKYKGSSTSCSKFPALVRTSKYSIMDPTDGVRWRVLKTAPKLQPPPKFVVWERAKKRLAEGKSI
ncbi:hypothetical protein BV25DRAFT_1920619 [Artomyces pyxidatus]|uniref:Uncharacterized protein n=1 Tax=Artomyces pyxidatus TaxID=48021 RepID=A0ACB8SLV3_9AGAM|nr:hypothetical protein BV25DRAFT_1920619 [Artomyces pyxidatus]